MLLGKMHLVELKLIVKLMKCLYALSKSNHQVEDEVPALLAKIN